VGKGSWKAGLRGPPALAVSALGLTLALLLRDGASVGSTLYAYAAGAVLFGGGMLIVLLVLGLVGWIRRRFLGDPDARYRRETAGGRWWWLLLLVAVLGGSYWDGGARALAFLSGYGLGIELAGRLGRPLFKRALALEDERAQ
jgi:uncharacterized iron-regulated membrane protein